MVQRCEREDLNLHALRRYHLKVVRLPISPRSHNSNLMKKPRLRRQTFVRLCGVVSTTPPRSLTFSLHPKLFDQIAQKKKRC